MMAVRVRSVFYWLCLQVSFVSVLSDTWKAEVVPKIDALVKSCVVVPCTYNYPGMSLPTSQLRAIWHKKDQKEYIYHKDSTLVADNFKGRTKLIGDLGQKNCTLEIDGVKDHDNGPFCFRIEIPDLDKFSFVEQCVTISMISTGPQPELQYKKSFEEGQPAILKCNIRYTCPSHPPSLTWSRRNEFAEVSYKVQQAGVWEMESLLSFSATEQDDHTDITCKADFHGGLTTEATGQIYVKKQSGKPISYIIPVAAVIGTSILFGVVCFFMVKKYKRQIQELQSRNENGIWSRMSRMSQRFRSRYRRDTDMQVANRSNNF
ncbi:myeloid cell surface antigen CD33-like isoform X2 [Brachyhypopomus gauderio]